MLTRWPLAEMRNRNNFKASFHSAVGWVWAERFIEISNPGQAGLCVGLGVGRKVPLSRAGIYSQEKNPVSYNPKSRRQKYLLVL